MKHLSILALLLALAIPAGTQNQSLSIPSSVPVHCSKQANNCNFLFGPHTTAILVAKQSAGGDCGVQAQMMETGWAHLGMVGLMPGSRRDH